jgi:hypothetical protein
MDDRIQEIREILLRLDERVLEIDLAHRDMVQSLLDALTAAKEINRQVGRKWFLVVHFHKRLAKEIRQLLRELNEIKHQINANIQSAAKSES